MDILNHQQIEIKTQRMACEIAECYAQEQELTLCGLNERGYYLAQRLAQEIGKFTPHLKINLIQVQTLDGVSFEPVSSFAKKHIFPLQPSSILATEFTSAFGFPSTVPPKISAICCANSSPIRS